MVSGALRLNGTGSTLLHGRLEVYYRGSWGTVCNDGFSGIDAGVVCRQLGFVGGVVLSSSAYGAGSGKIWLDDVACTGSETRIQDCRHNGWGIHNCNHNDDVGISCATTRVLQSTVRSPGTPKTTFGFSWLIDPLFVSVSLFAVIVCARHVARVNSIQNHIIHRLLLVWHPHGIRTWATRVMLFLLAPWTIWAFSLSVLQQSGWALFAVTLYGTLLAAARQWWRRKYQRAIALLAGGDDDTSLSDSEEEKSVHSEAESIASDCDVPIPAYWTNKTNRGEFLEDETTRTHVGFDQMVYVQGDLCSKFGELLDTTFRPITTQDRPCPKPDPNKCAKVPGGCPCVKPGGDPGLPTKYVLRRVIRVEDSEMWVKYIERRNAIQLAREVTGDVDQCNPEVMTQAVTNANEDMFAPLDSSLNEVYLWHGTHVRAALSIAQNDFRLDLAGSASGTMYGKGAYMAESITKADEYAEDEPGGYYDGVFAMLLLRVCLGKYYYTTTRDTTAKDKVLSGAFDSTLGDRAAAVNTFREFVVYNSDQLYPEYVVLYQRQFAAADPDRLERAAKIPFHLELPVYWRNVHMNPSNDKFRAKLKVRPSTQKLIAKLVTGAVASGRVIVEMVHRIEDSQMWTRYAEFRQEVKAALLLDSGFPHDEIETWRAPSNVAETRSTEDWNTFMVTPVLREGLTKLAFECTWRDQDYGNKKGEVMAHLVDSSGKRHVSVNLFGVCRADGRKGWTPVKRVLEADSNMLVAAGQHTATGVKIVIEYKTGGGGGHKLFIRDFQCTAVYEGIGGSLSVRRACHCTPPNELDGNPDAGHVLTNKLLEVMNAEDSISTENLDETINEMLLWHGTSRAAAEAISKTGFKIASAAHGRRFGDGAYLAEDLSKSISYTQPDGSGICFVLLCRTTCGNFYYTEASSESNAHENAQSQRANTILANPSCSGPREFIVLTEKQVYPEFIIQLRT